MLDLPELNDVVCLQLTRHDLAQCARVNKKWHTVVLPYLWRDLSCLNDSSDAQRQAFVTVLCEDYLHERQGAGESLQARVPTVSTLTKYIPWIQILPDPENLFRSLNNLRWPWELMTGDDEEPTRRMLRFHLFDRCRSAKLSHFCLRYDHHHKLDDLDQAILESVLFRVRHLSVQVIYHYETGELDKLHYLLDKCSTALEKLTFDIDNDYVDNMLRKVIRDKYLKIQGNQDPNDGDYSDGVGPKEWSSLKELVLGVRYGLHSPHPSKFWSWIFKRCGQVEHLEVTKMNDQRGSEAVIAEAALTHMPNLVHLTLGHDPEDGFTFLRDNQVATLLGGSRKGWKTVRLQNNTSFESLSMVVLEKHSTTLEVFTTDVPDMHLGFSSLIRVLRFCPILHTFADSEHKPHFRYPNALNEFIDQDPETGLLRAWACEPSLKVLNIRIPDVPRPDITGNVRETYPGQGRELQGLAYDRFARLTNLEILWLGNGLYPRRSGYSMRKQGCCLEMSLESGLHKLSGLKKLKELNIAAMEVRVGVKEVQWMVEHWPRLQ
ncbi:hypothetical protein BGX34_005985, partial [Mortierella sp. NVP85]